MKLERKSNYVREYSKNSILNEATKELGDNFSADALLEYLLEDDEYSIRKYERTHKSIFNRINIPTRKIVEPITTGINETNRGNSKFIFLPDAHISGRRSHCMRLECAAMFSKLASC